MTTQTTESSELRKEIDLLNKFKTQAIFAADYIAEIQYAKRLSRLSKQLNKQLNKEALQNTVQVLGHRTMRKLNDQPL